MGVPTAYLLFTLNIINTATLPKRVVVVVVGKVQHENDLRDVSPSNVRIRWTISSCSDGSCDSEYIKLVQLWYSSLALVPFMVEMCLFCADVDDGDECCFSLD